MRIYRSRKLTSEVLCLLLLVGGVLTAGCTKEQGTPQVKQSHSDMISLAVGTFGASEDTPMDVVRSLNDLFSDALADTGKFNLLERARMKDIEEEYLRMHGDRSAVSAADPERGDDITFLTALLSNDSSLWVNMERGKKLRASDQ
ncbi:MAG TPA: CsgG/HfaB family protein, partial [bacterium]|nr:CsgG/HfaB family protein [bacterium]